MGSETTMRVFGSIESMKQARRELGSPAALNEALVATGIDALFVLLDGGTVEIEGQMWVLRNPGSADG
jgi:hypothetical protein